MPNARTPLIFDFTDVCICLFSSKKIKIHGKYTSTICSSAPRYASGVLCARIITSDETKRQLLTKLIVLGSPILISIGIFDKYSDQGVGKIAFDQPRKVVSIYFG